MDRGKFTIRLETKNLSSTSLPHEGYHSALNYPAFLTVNHIPGALRNRIAHVLISQISFGN